MLAQAHRRALAHDPQCKEMFDVLLDPYKLLFRKAWGMKHDHGFVKDSKVITSYHKAFSADDGQFMTIGQIIEALGGGALRFDSQEYANVLAQARKYVAKCKEMGGKFVIYNNWLEVEQVVREYVSCNLSS